MTDRAEGGASNLADALRNRVRHGKKLIRLFVQQQMIIAEMRSAHMPMEVFGFQVQHEYVREDRVQRTRDVLSCLGLQIGRGIEWGHLLKSQVVLLRVRCFHIRPSCLRVAEECRLDFSQETSALQAYRFCFSHGSTHLKDVTPPSLPIPTFDGPIPG